MAYQKCTWNANLRCPNPLDCPLQDVAWHDVLDVWAMVGRTPPSLNWERFGEPNPKTEGEKSERKAEVARLFYAPEAVFGALSIGFITKSICEELCMGRYLWNETQAGISLRRARERWIEKVRK